MTSRPLLIGVDDTDDLRGPGTGRRARELGAYLEDRGLGVGRGVTRHQLLVDERIPYTSHNSSLCLLMESDASLDLVVGISRDFLSGCCAGSSDPGLCVAWAEAITTAVVEFGREAQRSVLSKAGALRLAAGYGMFLEELGGSGDGVIGALAAVGLRASGNDGRFVELRGIRELRDEAMLAGEILDGTAITSIEDDNGRALPADALVHFGGWLRPSLRGGRPVLLVRSCSDENALSNGSGLAAQKGWVTVEYKFKSPDGPGKAHAALFPHGYPPGSGLGRLDSRQQEVR